MARYAIGCFVGSGLAVYLDGENNREEDLIFELSFDLANHLDSGVELKAAVKQLSPELEADQLSLEVSFIDVGTGDVLYRVSGYLNPDDEATSSIVSIMDALDDFSNVELTIDEDYIADLADLDLFNEFESLGRNAEVVSIPTAAMPTVPTVYDVVSNMDIEPISLYMQFTNDFGLFTQLLRVANKFNVDLWVELDPTLTLDQVYLIAEDLAPYDHHVRLVWSPIIARPLNAVGLKGKKLPRQVGGYIMAQTLLRRASTNVQGIPPLHTPIAGYDFPVVFAGIEQKPDVIFSDYARKKLANLQVNAVQRVRYESGVRFVIGDCLTAYGDNTSLLKVTNASDISMFIDNRIKGIIKRHLLKAMDTMIEDALKECVRFLDACTSKERPLLVKAKEFSGFYDLTIVPSEDRPFDKVKVKCRYRPQGAARAADLDTEVTK